MPGQAIGSTGLKLHSNKFPGIYRGKVLSNTDSDMLGRIKVQAYPMFADITDPELLPYAVPMYPIWDGSGTETGCFAVPDIDTFVFVMFEAGDMYQPIYIGEAPTATKGLPQARIPNYPTRKASRTSGGVEFYVDDTLGEIKLSKFEPITSGGEVVTDSVADPLETLIASVHMEWDGRIIAFSPNNIILDSKIVKVTGNIDLANGWTGTFSTGDNRIVSVSQGVITSVE